MSKRVVALPGHQHAEPRPCNGSGTAWFGYGTYGQPFQDGIGSIDPGTSPATVSPSATNEALARWHAAPMLAASPNGELVAGEITPDGKDVVVASGAPPTTRSSRSLRRRPDPARDQDRPGQPQRRRAARRHHGRGRVVHHHRHAPKANVDSATVTDKVPYAGDAYLTAASASASVTVHYNNS